MGFPSSIFHPKKRNLRQAYEEDAAAIEAFVDGRGNQWDWDDYISIRDNDPFLESTRIRSVRVSDDFPPRTMEHYCSDEGIEVLRSLARELRTKANSIPEA